MGLQYLTDADGNRIAVVLDLDTYSWMVDELEEADATRAYDAAIAAQADAEMLSLDQAVAEIEAEWGTSERKVG